MLNDAIDITVVVCVAVAVVVGLGEEQSYRRLTPPMRTIQNDITGPLCDGGHTFLPLVLCVRARDDLVPVDFAQRPHACRFVLKRNIL